MVSQSTFQESTNAITHSYIYIYNYLSDHNQLPDNRYLTFECIGKYLRRGVMISFTLMKGQTYKQSRKKKKPKKKRFNTSIIRALRCFDAKCYLSFVSEHSIGHSEDQRDQHGH